MIHLGGIHTTGCAAPSVAALSLRSPAAAGRCSNHVLSARPRQPSKRLTQGCCSGQSESRALPQVLEADNAVETTWSGVSALLPLLQYPRRVVLSTVIAAPFAAAATMALADDDGAQESIAVPSLGAARVYLDASIAGEPVGRIVVECEDTVGGQRLLALAKGEERGNARVSYLRRLEVVDIASGAEGYVTTAPLQKISNLDGSPVFDLPGGESGNGLRAMAEAERADRSREGTNSIWLRVFDDNLAEPQQVITTRNGKLVMETELGTPQPNGTSLALCIGKCSSALAKTHVYVGRLVEGTDVVQAMLELDTVPVNRKLQYGSGIADITAPRQNRPFKKVNLKAGML